jgi:hypothetical protein
LGRRGVDRRWASHGGRGGGGEELVGERFPDEEGGQVLVQQLQQEKRKLLGWLDRSEEGRKDGFDGRRGGSDGEVVVTARWFRWLGW